MCLQYTSMAYHHLIALIIFALFFTETNTLCVFSLLPFLLHASFWVFTDTSSLTVLFLYNWTFLLVGLISIAVWIVDSRRTSWRLPLLCVFEVACNTYNYCWDFRGKECPDTSFISTTNRKLGLAILVGCLSTILVLISTVLGLIAKRYYYGAEQGKGNIGKVVVNKMSSRRISTRSSTKHSGALLVKEE